MKVRNIKGKILNVKLYEDMKDGYCAKIPYLLHNNKRVSNNIKDISIYLHNSFNKYDLTDTSMVAVYTDVTVNPYILMCLINECIIRDKKLVLNIIDYHANKVNYVPLVNENIKPNENAYRKRLLAYCKAAELDINDAV